MEKTKKVKNISGRDLNVIGVGIVKIDGEVMVDEGFNNANFEIVGSSNAKPQTKSEEKKDEEKVEDIIKEDKIK